MMAELPHSFTVAGTEICGPAGMFTTFDFVFEHPAALVTVNWTVMFWSFGKV